MKKITNVSNYGKFICNIFGRNTVKTGVTRVKVQFSEWNSKDRLIKNFFYLLRVWKIVVDEMQPSINQPYKKSSLFCFYKFLCHLRIHVYLNGAKPLAGIKYILNSIDIIRDLSR